MLVVLAVVVVLAVLVVLAVMELCSCWGGRHGVQAGEVGATTTTTIESTLWLIL